MQKEIDQDKLISKGTLMRGLREECADDITETIINLEDGTCDYLELIPLLEEVARIDWFCYFDDNGAGGFPHADMRRNTSFRSSALKAIENIRENAKLESTSRESLALKCNSTEIIGSTLARLKAEGTIADKSLIPILEKIARKDLYRKYSYLSGFEDDCRLGELAREVIQLIKRNSERKTNVVMPRGSAGCSTCGSLPDDITVNSGRGEPLPDSFRLLAGMNSQYHPDIFRCPNCYTYYKWFDIRQYYTPDNNDEQRLVRLSPEVSRLLDQMFTVGPSFRPGPSELKAYSEKLSPDLLLDVVHYCMRDSPDALSVFLPGLLITLRKTNDSSLWYFLNERVSKDKTFAQELLDTFSSSRYPIFDRTIEILQQCLKVTKKE